MPSCVKGLLRRGVARPNTDQLFILCELLLRIRMSAGGGGGLRLRWNIGAARLGEVGDGSSKTSVVRVWRECRVNTPGGARWPPHLASGGSQRRHRRPAVRELRLRESTSLQ